jgi:hypothetical protein
MLATMQCRIFAIKETKETLSLIIVVYELETSALALREERRLQVI